ncbi:hypothetical protein B0H14DRAFT_3430140 [Mycena olivaceomarginata]|nr:hypothetical protein B0H14DRAFT_3430140 [Mycena olivaceomarginata]
MTKSVASDARSSSYSLPARASATLKTVKNATKKATAVSKTMQQVVSVARPNHKRRRTSKADAALEAGEDEIGFLADFPPLIPEHEDHAIRCFGQNVVDAAIRGNTTKNPDGLIFAASARAGQRPVDVTHRAHTNAEARNTPANLVSPQMRGLLRIIAHSLCGLSIFPSTANPLSFLLDIIEVLESHSDETLARAFDQFLATHSLNTKACIF